MADTSDEVDTGERDERDALDELGALDELDERRRRLAAWRASDRVLWRASADFYVGERLAALAHPMRMRLCRNLARAPYTTSELADTYGITAPEVSRHLAVLKKAGLISTRRRGRYVLHQLDVTAVARLGSDFLETVLR